MKILETSCTLTLYFVKKKISKSATALTDFVIYLIKALPDTVYKATKT